MSGAQELWDLGSLQFFGKVSASISHEIKNVLAVIRETSGLMEDLILMNQKGKPLDVERLKNLAEKIRRQTGRADEIVKNMNRFAHSVDEPVKTVAVKDCVELILSLFQRSAGMRGVVLQADLPEDAVTVTANLFFLQNLLGNLVEMAVDGAGDEKRIRVGARKCPGGVEVIFRGFQPCSASDMEESLDVPTRRLLALLEAKLHFDVDQQALVAHFPVNRSSPGGEEGRASG